MLDILLKGPFSFRWYTCEWIKPGWETTPSSTSYSISQSFKKSLAAHLAWFLSAKSSTAKSSTCAHKPTALQQSTYTKPVILLVGLRSAVFTGQQPVLLLRHTSASALSPLMVCSLPPWLGPPLPQWRCICTAVKSHGSPSSPIQSGSSITAGGGMRERGQRPKYQ